MTSTPGVLNQFAGLYLKARWPLGAGLVLIAAIYFLFDLSSPTTWTLGAGGLVILAHASAMGLMPLTSVHIAMLVDITATHLAVAYMTVSIEDEIALALVFISATVLIALFSDGWIRVILFAYSTSFVVIALLAVNGWGLGGVDEIIGVLFAGSLIAGVIAMIRRKLVELEAIRAQTLGVVSHELRNNLAGVIGATEMLMDSDFTLDAEDRSELITLSHQQALDAGDIIEDLLVASRVERGVLEAVPESVDLVPLTESVIRRSTSLDGRDIALDVPARSPLAMADPLRYRQVLRNLLSNAIRYGGPNIKVSIEQSGSVVSVMVIDDGEGIDPASVHLLFRPYYRNNDDPTSGSTGLGLWIGRDLARKMDGDLRYQRRNVKTIFTMTLPSAASESSSKELVDSVVDSLRPRR